MSKQRLKNESEMVKSLGELIGYGHLMSLAAAHWRKMFKDRNEPIDGAFIPTLPMNVEKSVVPDMEKTIKLYDKIIEY